MSREKVTKEQAQSVEPPDFRQATESYVSELSDLAEGVEAMMWAHNKVATTTGYPSMRKSNAAMAITGRMAEAANFIREAMGIMVELHSIFRAKSNGHS